MRATVSVYSEREDASFRCIRVDLVREDGSESGVIHPIPNECSAREMSRILQKMSDLVWKKATEGGDAR